MSYVRDGLVGQSETSDKLKARIQYRNAIRFLLPDDSAPHHDHLIDQSFNTAWASGQQSRRFYHVPSHYLEVASDLPSDDLPIDVTDHKERAQVWQDDKTNLAAVRYLAGLHHDIVYHHVDHKSNEGEHVKGFLPSVAETVEQLVHVQHMVNMKDSTPVLMVHQRDDLDPDAKALVRMAMRLFGFNEEAPNVPLQCFVNQNEFLSAIYAAQLGCDLGLPLKAIIQEMVLIEGTAPFYKADRFEQLEDALRDINKRLPADQQLSEAEIIETIDVAVEVANKDVENFAYQDFENGFLPNSRNLILEGINGPLYPPRNGEIRGAMDRMHAFMNFISATDSPMRIFHAAHGKPSAEELEKLEAQAQTNISQLKEYLQSDRAFADTLRDIQKMRRPDSGRER